MNPTIDLTKFNKHQGWSIEELTILKAIFENRTLREFLGHYLQRQVELYLGGAVGADSTQIVADRAYLAGITATVTELLDMVDKVNALLVDPPQPQPSSYE